MAQDPYEAARIAFRQRLRASREARGWSLGDAQRMSGVTGSLWRKYENGDVEPKLTQLLRIQRAFGFASLELLLALFRRRACSPGTARGSRRGRTGPSESHAVGDMRRAHTYRHRPCWAISGVGTVLPARSSLWSAEPASLALTDSASGNSSRPSQSRRAADLHPQAPARSRLRARDRLDTSVSPAAAVPERLKASPLQVW
jgi:transcriptional regulator with XRE-family HTH domain